MKKQKENEKSKRTFPVKYTALLVVIILAQIGLIIFGITYEPSPQDVIHQYQVTVTPLEDGSLDIEYRLVWEALDPSEPLTWVDIGMPNGLFAVYPDSVSDNISQYSTYVDEDYVAARLEFHEAYYDGDVIDFSFKVNQKNMLCQNDQGYFYEFVPGWFNAIRVEQYEFVWNMDGFEDYVQRGSLDYGEYRKMTVQYGMEEFSGCKTARYVPFDDSGAYNELAEDKTGMIVLCCVIILLLVIGEVFIIDCYVSYGRGRGFLTGYGHHIHTHGRTNPVYIRTRNAHRATHGGRGGGRSGGCACACACACAGGGRAGCSQKDTYESQPSQ